MKQNRLKSPVMWAGWASVASLTLRVGMAETAQSKGDMIFLFAIMAIAMYGVANNPTDRNDF